MYISRAGSLAVDLLLVALAVGGLGVAVWLVVSAVRERRRRWIRVGAAAASVLTVVVVGGLWFSIPRVDGGYCLMESLSEAVASSADTPDERACQSKGRHRLVAGGGLALVIFAAGGLLASPRRDQGDRHLTSRR
jgi:hypothetical protein